MTPDRLQSGALDSDQAKLPVYNREPEQINPAEQALNGHRFAPPLESTSRFLQIALLAAPWGFIGYLIWSERGVLEELRDNSLLPLVLAAALVLGAEVGAGLLWIALVRRVKEPSDAAELLPLLRAFVRGWVARYIPGSIWTFGARLVNMEPGDVSRNAMIRSFVWETVLIAGAAAAVGLAFWSSLALGPVGIPPLLALGLLIVAVTAMKADRLSNAALRFVERLRGRTHDEFEAGSSTPALGAFLRMAGAYVAVNIVLGVAFVVCAQSFGETDAEDLTVLGGAYILAGAIGMVTPFVPAGLGVREAVLVGLAAPVVSAPVAASVAVTVRLLTVAADLVFFGAVEALTRFSHRSPSAGLTDRFTSGGETR